MEIKQRSFKHAESVQAEGIVLLGAGGDPHEWLNGVHNLWVDEGSTTGSLEEDITEAFTLSTTRDRTDLVMVFSNHDHINIGKLAMWRLRFGDCSWLSDYKVNYADQQENGDGS